jgi:hypothetical protein
MAQRPAVPRHREAPRCADDDRARSRVCLRVVPRGVAAPRGRARRQRRTARRCRYLMRHCPAHGRSFPLGTRSRERPAGGEARACRSWRTRALPTPDERSRCRPTGLRARPQAGRRRPLPSSKQQSRPARLLGRPRQAQAQALPSPLLRAGSIHADREAAGDRCAPNPIAPGDRPGPSRFTPGEALRRPAGGC